MIVPAKFLTFDSWAVGISVYPSAENEDFLSACPLLSYEGLVRITGEKFRQRSRDWQTLDLAHWILLIDENAGDVTVHLHTIWNTKSTKQLINIMPPVIIPEELMREDLNRFIFEMILEDLDKSR